MSTQQDERPGAVAGEIATREPEAQRGALVPRDNGVLHPDTWAMFGRIANTVADTDFVPKGLRQKPSAVMACLLYGHALGLHPSVSLTEVYVIDGRPSISAALMAGKIRESGHSLRREEVRDEQGKITGVTAVGVRADGGEDSYTFTLEMASRAGLLSKDNWKKYPEAMLWARACSQLARMLFSDVFLGQATYTPEEIEEEARLRNGGPGGDGVAEEADYGDDPETAATLLGYFELLEYLPAKRTLALANLDDEGRRDLLARLELECREKGLELGGVILAEEDAEDEALAAAEAAADSVMDPAEADRIWKSSGEPGEQPKLPVE